MKYVTAIEASKIIGVAERTIRLWIEQGKLTAHHPQPNRLAIPLPEVERIARERRQYQSGQSDASGQPDISDMLAARIQELEQKISNLESRVENLSSPETHIERFHPPESIDYPSQSTTRSKKAYNRNQPLASTSPSLPEGYIMLTDFADRYGVAISTAKHHIVTGFKVGTDQDKLQAESRPRPGRPGQTQYYLSPDQQRDALDYWQRHGVQFSHDEEKQP